DIMMPEMDGWELCQEIREISDVPIIMLTARDQREDIIKGLQLGADDYITKPFNEDELLARMAAILRRRVPNVHIEINGLLWNKEQFELTYKDVQIKLMPKEFIMISHFMRNPKSQNEINDLLWNKEQLELTYKDVQIKLTPKEFIMFGHFIRNPNQVFARVQLIDLIWRFDSETEGMTVDSHVRNMRDKIRQ